MDFSDFIYIRAGSEFPSNSGTVNDLKMVENWRVT